MFEKLMMFVVFVACLCGIIFLSWLGYSWMQGTGPWSKERLRAEQDNRLEEANSKLKAVKAVLDGPSSEKAIRMILEGKVLPATTQAEKTQY